MVSAISRRLQGRVAIVTGASRGIGRASALRLAREGANVLVNYKNEAARAEEVVQEIERLGAKAFAFQADVGDRHVVAKMIERAYSEFGHVDILVNNAGMSVGDGSLLEFKEDAFPLIARVNVEGALNCTRGVAPQMMKRHYGKIVNITSVAGLGTSALPGSLLYSSTKAALIALTKRVALELGKYGITVNAIAPGVIKTSRPRTKQFIESIEKISMLGRVGEPDDVANAVLFLASDDSSFITAQIIAVDGGRTDFITHSL